jgi:hypothetical protein
VRVQRHTETHPFSTTGTRAASAAAAAAAAPAKAAFGGSAAALSQTRLSATGVLPSPTQPPPRQQQQQRQLQPPPPSPAGTVPKAETGVQVATAALGASLQCPSPACKSPRLDVLAGRMRCARRCVMCVRACVCLCVWVRFAVWSYKGDEVGQD